MAILRGLAVIGSFAVLFLAVPNANASVSWSSCPKLSRVECTTIKVPLNYAKPTDGEIKLHVARKQVTDPAKPWLLYLAGGPGGEGARSFFSEGLAGIDVIKNNFNLMAYDQRGTGKSGALSCGVNESSGYAAIKRCAKKLGSKRRFYGTDSSIEDIEQLRQQLGIDQLNLYGTSYGTRLALSYARTYPTSVARMILDGVDDPDENDPLHQASYQTLRRSLKSLCPNKCRGLTKDPVRDLKVLYRRLQKKPLVGYTLTPSGRRVKGKLTATSLALMTTSGDYVPAFRAAMPAAVQAALKNKDASPLLRFQRTDPAPSFNKPEKLSIARLLVNCGEAPLPWAAKTPLKQRAKLAQRCSNTRKKNAFIPFDAQFAGQVGFGPCISWPDAGSNKRKSMAFPAVPTLILQSTDDMRTPPSMSAKVAKRIPGCQRVVVPATPHAAAIVSPCVQEQVAHFIAGDRVEQKCQAFPTGIATSNVAPKSLQAVKPAKGISPLKVARTISAVHETVDDARVFSTLSIWMNNRKTQGLHGGFLKVVSPIIGKVDLSNYQLIQGVKVSGRFTHTGYKMRVEGKGVSKGHLKFSAQSGKLTGVLDGQTIKWRAGK